MVFTHAAIWCHPCSPTFTAFASLYILSDLSTWRMGFHKPLSYHCSFWLFIPYDLAELVTAFTPDAIRHPTLSWFLDCFTTITGFDCTCPHLSQHHQLPWLSSLLPVMQWLATHYNLSCFYIIVHLPTDLDYGNDFFALIKKFFPPCWPIIFLPKFCCT